MTKTDEIATPADVVHDPLRLDAVRATNLLDSESEEAFDRLTRLAARLTGAPVTFISVVDENRDFYKACYGFPEPLATERQLTGTTFCHYAIASKGPLVIEDTTADPMYREVPTVTSLGVRAYLGIPLITADGQTLGSFCAIDFAPRKWSPLDIEAMKELATSTMREVELRAAIRTAREERRLLDATIRHLPVGVMVMSPDGKIALSNARANAILGTTIAHVDQLEGWPLAGVLRDREIVTDERVVLERADAQRIIRVSAAPVIDGELIAAVVAFEDITERETLLASLDRERSRLRAVLESVPAGILVAEAPSGAIVLFNRQAEEILGGDGPTVVSEDGPLARALRGEVTHGAELQYERRSGEHIWISVHGAPVRDAAGNIAGGIVVFHDITEQRLILFENQRLYEEAERANRAKDEFFAAVTHELRTPMTSIIGWARILKMEALGSPDAVEAAEMIESSARVQARLVDDLLDVSRITAKKIVLERQPLDLREVIEEAVRATEPDASSQRVRLRTALEPNVIVEADRSRLRQIFGNLLSNAIKFTTEGGLVTVTSQVIDQVVEITVSDTGRGIAPELLPQVFDRGRQARDAEHGGLGLGLTIVRHLVELHGGSVRAESEGEGKGASLFVTLPRATLMA